MKSLQEEHPLKIMLQEEGHIDSIIISQSNPIVVSTFEIDHYLELGC
jgi:hypothetical protein